MNNRGILFGQREEDIVSEKFISFDRIEWSFPLVSHRVLSTIRFKEAGKKHLIGNILKTYFHRIYTKRYLIKFLYLIKQIYYFLYDNFLLQLELVEITELDFRLYEVLEDLKWI